MRGEKISVIVGMTVNGILDLQIVRGSVNGDKLMDFVERVLLPRLMPSMAQTQTVLFCLTTALSIMWRGL